MSEQPKQIVAANTFFFGDKRAGAQFPVTLLVDVVRGGAAPRPRLMAVTAKKASDKKHHVLLRR